MNLEDYNLEIYRKYYSPQSLNEKRFYNFGAGPIFSHPFWTKIDFKNDWPQDGVKQDVDHCKDFIDYDFMSGKDIALPNNSAEIVYSSHVLEHISDYGAQNAMNQAFRLLKDGGIFRLVVPDTRLSYDAYLRDDKEFFFWYYKCSPERAKEICCKYITRDNTSSQQLFLYSFASQLSDLHICSSMPKLSDKDVDKIFSDHEFEDALDLIVKKISLDVHAKFVGNHINWWTENKARRMLVKAGFNKVYRSGWSQSSSPALRNSPLFDSTYPQISLFMEAIKQ